VPSIQSRYPQLWPPPIADGSWLAVLLIVLGVLGTALLMGTFLVGIGWIAGRVRQAHRTRTSNADTIPDMTVPGGDEDPITRALQAVALGTIYETEPLLRVIAEQSSPLAPRARLALTYVVSSAGHSEEAEAVGREALRANPELLPLCVE